MGWPRERQTLVIMSRIAVIALACTGFPLGQPPQAHAQARDLPSPLAYLRDVDPTILQDIRYASADNFTGRPLPGYGASECILSNSVAQALARVQRDLAPKAVSLKVYDCYRPQRAVKALLAWTRDRSIDPSSQRFHPRVSKSSLHALGYIAGRSDHSRGTAIDLTLVQMPAETIEAFEPRRAYGACTQPKAQRAPDSGIDMGTGFDCFDALSFTASTHLSQDQQQARHHLISAMARHGFRNYFREWWHFSLDTKEAAGRGFDVPIQSRP